MILIDALRIARSGIGAFRARLTRSKPAFSEVSSWMKVVHRDGVCVVPDFFDHQTCAEIREEILRIVAHYPDVVHTQSNGADCRVFGAEHASAAIRAFAEEPRLLNAARTRLGNDASTAFTLAGLIRHRKENLGSGDGWHRDSFFNQFKALVYITDVTEETGPFEYILRSHLLRDKFSVHRNYGVPLNSSRIDESPVRKLISAEPERHRFFPGQMGTLVLADTTGIHRGMPLVRGERFALTNYYHPAKTQNSRLFEHFRPLLGRDVPVSDPF